MTHMAVLSEYSAKSFSHFWQLRHFTALKLVVAFLDRMWQFRQ